MEGIQFVARFKDWTAVRKLSIKEKTDPLTVMEFLAGLSESFDGKIEEFLAKEVDLKELNKTLNEVLEGVGKGKKGVSEALSKVNGMKVNRTISKLCKGLNKQKKEKKEIKEFCKIYAMRKALKKVGLRADYSTIESPLNKGSKAKIQKINK